VTITAEMLAIKKPGSGLPPARLGEVLGRRAARTIEADEVLTEADVAWTEPQA
jgi:N,N'-diacetyllegionaminate synthase